MGTSTTASSFSQGEPYATSGTADRRPISDPYNDTNAGRSIISCTMCAETIRSGRFNLSTFNFRLSTDSHAGLYDFPAREYSIQGRWPSPDPAGLAAVDPSNPQSWNRYAYVTNNPLSLIDPAGLSECAPGEHDCNWGLDEGNPGQDILGGAPTGFEPFATIENDCNGGPCFPFMQFLENGCVASVSYYTVNGAGGQYSMPEVSTLCGGPQQGGGGHGNGSGNGCALLLGGCNASIGADTTTKKNYCSHQADLAALENAFPGITKGDYVSTAAKISLETGAHLGLEGAAASNILTRAIRARTGIAMSTTATFLERLTVALVAYSGYEVLKASHDEYQACMNY